MAPTTKLSNASILARAASMSDQEWFEILTRSVDYPLVDGLELPGFPSEAFQVGTVGSSGVNSLYEGFKFYSLIKRYASSLGIGFDPNSTCILDFGCGWGRMIRFFLKDVIADNLYGVDVDPAMIDTCIKTVRYGNYSLVNPTPPTHLPDSSVDIVFAYSVFSHLSESVHLQWLQEFSRILKPGGIILATTQPRRFIEYCRSLRGQNHDFLWHQFLAASFVDTEAAYSDYDNGKFLYSATGGGPARDASFYGEALIPCEYVKREWTKYFRFCDFVDDPDVLPQALIVVQKD